MSRSVVLALLRALLLVMLPALVAPASLAGSISSWPESGPAGGQPPAHAAVPYVTPDDTVAPALTSRTTSVEASAAHESDNASGAHGQSLSRSAPPSESDGIAPAGDDPAAWARFQEMPSPRGLSPATEHSGLGDPSIESTVVRGRAPPSGMST